MKMNEAFQYSSNLTTYKYPPQGTGSLEELKCLCKERLKLYKLFLETDAKCSNVKSTSKEWIRFVRHKIDASSLKTYQILLQDHNDNDNTLKARIQDHRAHWILSLCKLEKIILIYIFITIRLPNF